MGAIFIKLTVKATILDYDPQKEVVIEWQDGISGDGSTKRGYCPRITSTLQASVYGVWGSLREAAIAPGRRSIQHLDQQSLFLIKQSLKELKYEAKGVANRKTRRNSVSCY